MECPSCQFDNREGVTFCEECGTKLELRCTKCEAEVPIGRKFCGKCGQILKSAKDPSALSLEPEAQSLKPANEILSNDVTPITGERKHVTVLFSDLIGYTAISERLDPEEAKEITSRIFNEISKIISKYDGFIEKYAGDAVMGLFGATTAHEDDPIRAIQAAREIHRYVEFISPQYEQRIEQSLSMHTGLNTGLVVTGEINLEKGTHGVMGDTVNVASRLSSLGNSGEILVGKDTYRQAEGYFEFEDLGHLKIKGKDTPIRVYKALAPKEQPIKIHRLHGRRAELIGRIIEMDQLAEAVQKLRDGNGSIISIVGAAGTGKSRLVEEFKSSLDLELVQWMEGQAHPYTQNIPYYPLIDLLNRAIQIEEGDSPDIVKEKIENSLSNLAGDNSDLIPYIGSLYALSYPEIDELDPEYWKPQLRKAVKNILSALARQTPTIICLEDLHWADPSFLDLVKWLLTNFREAILFLCIYRPVISLFTTQQVGDMVNPYKEIRLQDLSPSESQVMVESLLKTVKIPPELKRFIQDKVGGNPFYVEEMVNSLIESDTLIRDGQNWNITRPITEAEISSTIYGLIAGRLDRLEKEAKQILQEASVIGRSFLYEILYKITKWQNHIDNCLSDLERLDLLRTKSVQPDLEYLFKHALTQEVVYNGLLKSERKVIHERIGLVMEELFKDRIPEIYGSLAFHFTRGQSLHKAIDYLMKAGERNLKRYSVAEAHQYYHEAFSLICNQANQTIGEKEIVIEILNRWAFVFFYRGDFKGLTDLLSTHTDLLKQIKNKHQIGMFYTWLGMGFYYREKLKDSYHFLQRAIQIGEEIGDQKIIGYACTWLTWTCSELGYFDEGIKSGERAVEISKLLVADHLLFHESLGGIGQIHYFMGGSKKNNEIGKNLIDYGKKNSNIRSIVAGNICTGISHFLAGDFQSSIVYFQEAIQVSADPLYTMWSKLYLGMSLVQNEQFQEAEEPLKDVVHFSEDYGYEIGGKPAYLFLGIVILVKGNISQGFKMIEETYKSWIEKGRESAIPTVEYILGKIYFEMVEGKDPIKVSTIAKNIGFLIKNIPFARRNAERYLIKAIATAKEVGDKGILGQAYLDLGRLQLVKGNKQQAQEYLSEAKNIFNRYELNVYLQQANEALVSLE